METGALDSIRTVATRSGSIMSGPSDECEQLLVGHRDGGERGGDTVRGATTGATEGVASGRGLGVGAGAGTGAEAGTSSNSLSHLAGGDKVRSQVSSG